MTNLDQAIEIHSTEKKNSTKLMKPNLDVMAKKIWHIVRVAYFMLRKGMSKGKLMFDLKLMIMKRDKKLSGKIHTSWSSAISAISSAAHRRSPPLKDRDFQDPPDAYEFSCSDSPANDFHKFHLPLFHLNKKSKNTHLFSCAFPALETEDEVAAIDAVFSSMSSPALPGFGKTPTVRQLRITDSPFPLRDIEEDNHVDEAAEEFINKFYRDLRRRNAMSVSS